MESQIRATSFYNKVLGRITDFLCEHDRV